MSINSSKADSEGLIGRAMERPRPRWSFTRLNGIAALVFGAIIAAAGVIIVLMPVAVTAKGLPSNPLFLWIIVPITGMLCISALLPLMLGKSMVEWGVRALRHATELHERGCLVQGVIHDRWARGSLKRRRHYVACRFTAELLDGSQRGIIFAERNAVAYFDYKIGDPVQVRYLPENPEICQMKG